MKKSSYIILIVVVLVIVLIVLMVLYLADVSETRDLQAQLAKEVERQRNIKPVPLAPLVKARHNWYPSVYKKEEMMYGVRVTQADLLQQSFYRGLNVSKTTNAFTRLLQKQFGSEKIVFRVENDPTTDLNHSYYLYGLNDNGDHQTIGELFKTNNQQLNLMSYLGIHVQMMPGDKHLLKARKLKGDAIVQKLSAYSFKVTEQSLQDHKTEQFTLHYMVGDENDIINSPCTTVSKKINKDGSLSEVGIAIVFCPSCMIESSVWDQALKVGLSSLDSQQLYDFLEEQTFDNEPKFIKVSNDHSEQMMSLHLMGVAASDLLRFLKSYDWPEDLVEFVRANIADLQNLNHEIEFLFMKNGGKVPVKTRFYGIL